MAQLGDGQFGFDLAATRVRRLGGRAHRDWGRKWSVFTDTLLGFSLIMSLGYNQYCDRVFIDTVIGFSLITRLGLTTEKCCQGCRHRYFHEHHATLIYVLLDTAWLTKNGQLLLEDGQYQVK